MKPSLASGERPLPMPRQVGGWLLLRRFSGHWTGLALAALVLMYSVAFYTGAKEGHLSHWVVAAVLLSLASVIV
jgi:uncharacterized membrane protein